MIGKLPTIIDNRDENTATERLGGVPTLIGETGIPFDLQKKKAYRSGNFKTQVRAMERSLQAMEEALLNYTIWNYPADNSNLRGDQWNDEDFSIFSRDQQKDPGEINSGGRALQALLRPYARLTAGEPLRMHFDIRKKVFKFKFRHDPQVSAPTELFIPAFQYPNGYLVQVSDGINTIDRSKQLLTYHHSARKDIHKIVVKPLKVIRSSKKNEWGTNKEPDEPCLVKIGIRTSERRRNEYSSPNPSPWWHDRICRCCRD